jgi:regulator of protease activity HflC (stomatin/prohibitin superfamily)
MMITVYVLIAIVTVVLVVLGSSVRVVTQFERDVVFRFGRVQPQTRVIIAEGELQASQKLRLLQTVVEVAAKKNSTLVLPFPVELLRFLERVTPPEVHDSVATDAGEPAPPAAGAQLNGAVCHGPADPAASMGEAPAHAVGR